MIQALEVFVRTHENAARSTPLTEVAGLNVQFYPGRGHPRNPAKTYARVVRLRGLNTLLIEDGHITPKQINQLLRRENAIDAVLYRQMGMSMANLEKLRRDGWLFEGDMDFDPAIILLRDTVTRSMGALTVASKTHRIGHLPDELVGPNKVRIQNGKRTKIFSQVSQFLGGRTRRIRR